MELVLTTGFAGSIAGVLFGKYQLEKWKISEKKTLILLALGSEVTFLAGGGLMALYGYHWLKILRYWTLLYALILLGILDYRKQIVPNKALLVLLGVRLLLLAGDISCFPELWLELFSSSLVGMLGGAGLFLIAGIIARNGLGMGDVKLIGVMGFFLGFRLLMSSLVITLTLTVLGGLFVLVTKKKGLKAELPFVPFAAVGTTITILLGF